jgi:hypothetical protein
VDFEEAFSAVLHAYGGPNERAGVYVYKGSADALTAETLNTAAQPAH